MQPLDPPTQSLDTLKASPLSVIAGATSRNNVSFMLKTAHNLGNRTSCLLILSWPELFSLPSLKISSKPHQGKPTDIHMQSSDTFRNNAKPFYLTRGY